MSEVLQQPVIDSRGGIHLHGRGGCKVSIQFQDSAGAARNVSGLNIYFEVEGKMRKLLAAGDTTDQRYLSLTRTEVASLYAPTGLPFVIIDESVSPEDILWTGEIYVEGWTTAP